MISPAGEIRATSALLIKGKFFAQARDAECPTKAHHTVKTTVGFIGPEHAPPSVRGNWWRLLFIFSRMTWNTLSRPNSGARSVAISVL